MNSCIGSINKLNNKSILGIIPANLPSVFINQLVEFYHDLNVTSFAFDFQGRVHNRFTQHMRVLFRNILDLDIANESFIYSCNTQKGKVMQGNTIIRANDIAVYNYGFDVVGDSHVIRPLPLNVAKKISNKSNDELNINIFNSYDYGYYKCSNWDSIKEIYPFGKTNISIGSFDVNVNNKKAIDSQKLFNSEILGLELNKYKSFIKNSESVSDYILSKKYFGGSVDSFKQFKRELNHFLN